jgi:hypothetical protein
MKMGPEPGSKAGRYFWVEEKKRKWEEGAAQFVCGRETCALPEGGGREGGSMAWRTRVLSATPTREGQWPLSHCFLVYQMKALLWVAL